MFVTPVTQAWNFPFGLRAFTWHCPVWEENYEQRNRGRICVNFLASNERTGGVDLCPAGRIAIAFLFSSESPDKHGY